MESLTLGDLPARWRALVYVTPGGCWEWRGPRWCGREYGSINGYLAHRVVFAHFNGTIPKGGVICHSCDNPPCVSPMHLWLGTQTDNMRDMRNKGRFFMKLNPETVREIRRRAAAGESHASLAREHGVTRPAISYAVNRVTWKEVD